MDLEDTLLMMPGPVPVAHRVLRAMSKTMINHRSAEFAEIHTDCRGILADVFNTKNDLKKRGVIIAGGQERLKSKIFRIGSMGNVTPRDVLSTVQQLEIVLNKRGYIDSVGADTEVATRVLDKL